MPPDCYSYKKMIVTNTPDGKVKVIYVTSEGQNTCVEEIILAKYFVRSLQVSAQNTFRERAAVANKPIKNK